MSTQMTINMTPWQRRQVLHDGMGEIMARIVTQDFPGALQHLNAMRRGCQGFAGAPVTASLDTAYRALQYLIDFPDGNARVAGTELGKALANAARNINTSVV